MLAQIAHPDAFPVDTKAPIYGVLSDLHPGRWRPDNQRLNENALNVLIDRAIDEAMELVLLGDFDEEEFLQSGLIGAHEYRMQRQIIAEALQRYQSQAARKHQGFEPKVHVIKGNHELTQHSLDDLREFYGDKVNFQLQGLIWQPDPEVVMTHGHLLEDVDSVRKGIEDCVRGNLSKEAFYRHLEQNGFFESEFFANGDGSQMLQAVIGFVCERLGIIDFETLSSDVIPRVLAVFKELEREWTKADSFSPLRGPLMGKIGMNRNAAMLGAAVGAKLVVVGHDHTATVHRRRVYDHQGSREVIVMDGGHWLSVTDQTRRAVVVNTRVGLTSFLTAQKSGEVYEEPLMDYRYGSVN